MLEEIKKRPIYSLHYLSIISSQLEESEEVASNTLEGQVHT